MVGSGCWSAGDAALNSGWVCLNNAGSYATSASWYGSLADAEAKCDAENECTVLHYYGADGKNWRAYKSVNSGTGAATMVKLALAPTATPAAGNPYPIPYTPYRSITGNSPIQLVVLV